MFIVAMGTVSIAPNAIGMSISQIINVAGNALCLAATKEMILKKKASLNL